MEERLLLLRALRLIDLLFSVIRVMNNTMSEAMKARWDMDWDIYHNLYQAAALQASSLAQAVTAYYGAEIDD